MNKIPIFRNPNLLHKMAGTIQTNIFPRLSPLNRTPSSSFLLRGTKPYSSIVFDQKEKGKMASEDGSPTIAQEPSPKIRKHHHDSPPFLKIKKLSENAVVPSRKSLLSAGYDLSSAVETKVPARGKALVPTDLSIAVPEGTYARIAPRSGLAWKHSIDVGAGVIDADYRGPVGVVLYNHSDVDFEVKPGDRIAQMIIERIMTPEITEVENLDATVRGVGGFGSTGV